MDVYRLSLAWGQREIGLENWYRHTQTRVEEGRAWDAHEVINLLSLTQRALDDLATRKINYTGCPQK